MIVPLRVGFDNTLGLELAKAEPVPKTIVLSMVATRVNKEDAVVLYKEKTYLSSTMVVRGPH